MSEETLSPGKRFAFVEGDIRKLHREAIRRASKKPCVYFVRSGPFVKIGHTADLDNRFMTYRTSSPFASYVAGVKLTSTVEEAYALECYLHQKFRAALYRSEWFRFTYEIQAYVTRLHRKSVPKTISDEWWNERSRYDADLKAFDQTSIDAANANQPEIL